MATAHKRVSSHDRVTLTPVKLRLPCLNTHLVLRDSQVSRGGGRGLTSYNNAASSKRQQIGQVTSSYRSWHFHDDKELSIIAESEECCSMVHNPRGKLGTKDPKLGQSRTFNSRMAQQAVDVSILV